MGITPDNKVRRRWSLGCDAAETRERTERTPAGVRVDGPVMRDGTAADGRVRRLRMRSLDAFNEMLQ
jgi:hypothetical protein